MAFNNSIPRATTDYLAKLEHHVDGRPVLYATRFLRPDGKLKAPTSVAVARFAVDAALKAATLAISSGIPSDGWLIATPAGIHIFKKTLSGSVGQALGTLTKDVIATVSVAHGKKATKTQITVTMVDQSFATVWVRTGETYPALSPWIRGASSAASVERGLTDHLPAEPAFDADHLYDQTTGQSPLSSG